jgi:hypothetical protein
LLVLIGLVYSKRSIPSSPAQCLKYQITFDRRSGTMNTQDTLDHWNGPSWSKKRRAKRQQYSYRAMAKLRKIYA